MKPFALLAVVAALAAGTASAQAPAAPAVPDPAVAFMATNGKLAGIKSLPSGLQYKVVASGPAGKSPVVGDIIKVHYEGALTNGSVFDSSFARGQSAIMPLEDLVPGWMEAIPLMKTGDEWVIYSPPALGYGERGAPPEIPPNAVLVFRIKLLGFLSVAD